MDNRKISIIITERDPQTRLDLKKALAMDKAYNIVSTAESFISSEYTTILNKADIVLLNVCGDSISLLKAAQSNKADRPVFILTAEPCQQTLSKESLQSGADYFLVKPLNMDTVARHIKEIYFFKRLLPSSGYAGKDSSGILEFTVKQLNSVRVGSHLKGYHYLITGVVALVEDAAMENNITKALYPYIAKKWQSTPVRVERAIRNAISTAWESGGGENFKALAGNLKTGADKPSNSQFMLTIANLYRSKYNSV
ncbi:MAG: hypothetical protein LBS84_08260 [Clostridiales bacterium]|jgi:two-component system response regulator (stage 0 sporulation protein A)|nr:hypothetical protein [Clostridiales bacterium]